MTTNKPEVGVDDQGDWVCDRCACEVDASDKLSDGSYRCDECFTFFAELNWYDPDNREDRLEDYLEMKKEDI